MDMAGVQYRLDFLILPEVNVNECVTRVVSIWTNKCLLI